MATWQPDISKAREWMRTHREGCISDLTPCDNEVRLALQKSGALSEINRLTALLAMKDETINTLRTQLHKATATFEDDYDSGYRAA